MNPVPVGVVGGGRFGGLHLKVLSALALEGKVRIAGLADVSEKALEARAREFGVPVFRSHRELLGNAKPAAVTIATPDPFHREAAADALAAGCHVLVEKPLDTSVAGCDAILAARKPGLLLEVDFHKRNDPYHREARRRVASGALGDVLYGQVHMENRLEVPRDWFAAWAKDSSPGWFLGIHFFDLAAWILGDRAVRVFATAQKRLLPSLGVDTLDALQASVVFSRGASVNVSVSWVLPESFEAPVNQAIRIVGTKGVVEIDSQDRGARACVAGEGMSTWNLGFLTEERLPGGGTRLAGYGATSISDFVEHVRHLTGGGKISDLDGLYATGEEARHATAIAEAAHRSAETGKVEGVRG